MQSVIEQRRPSVYLTRLFPENQSPKLVCSDCNAYSTHAYDGYRAQYLTKTGSQIWLLMFSCMCCGTQRGWGNSVERPTTANKGEIIEYPNYQSNRVN